MEGVFFTGLGDAILTVIVIRKGMHLGALSPRTVKYLDDAIRSMTLAGKNVEFNSEKHLIPFNPCALVPWW